MLLSWIWLGMMAASLLYGCLTGRAGALLPAALEAALQGRQLQPMLRMF